MTSPNSDDLRSVLARRLSRRALIQGGGGLLACSLVPAAAWPQTGGAALGFARVAASVEDRVIVPQGYTAEVVLRWGDALVDGVASLDARRVAAGALLEPGAAAAQAQQFGFNCDGIGLFALERNRWAMCVNHEFPQPELMFPGWAEARRTRARHEFVVAHPECVPVMQASVGVSIVELEHAGTWRYVQGSSLNRRITANTAMEFAGPAREHPLLAGPAGSPEPVFGTFSNCAAGVTPWGTYLTAEENTDDFFGNFAQAVHDPALAHAYARFGAGRAQESMHRWEFADSRFDVVRTPNESLKFGWIVEIDPRDAARPIKKRTALGRFKHEAATTVLTDDGRVAIYMGDDEAFEYLYKFVSAGRFDPSRPESNRDLLDSGTLQRRMVAARLERASGAFSRARLCIARRRRPALPRGRRPRRRDTARSSRGRRREPARPACLSRVHAEHGAQPERCGTVRCTRRGCGTRQPACAQSERPHRRVHRARRRPRRDEL